MSIATKLRHTVGLLLQVLQRREVGVNVEATLFEDLRVELGGSSLAATLHLTVGTDGGAGLLVGSVVILLDIAKSLVDHLLQIGVHITLLAGGVAILVEDILLGSLKSVGHLLLQLVSLVVSLDTGRLVEELGSLLEDGTLLQVAVETVLYIVVVGQVADIGDHALHLLLGSIHRLLSQLALVDVEHLVDIVVNQSVKTLEGVGEVHLVEAQSRLATLVGTLADEVILVVGLCVVGSRMNGDSQIAGLLLHLEVHLNVTALRGVGHVLLLVNSLRAARNHGTRNLHPHCSSGADEVCLKGIQAWDELLVDVEGNVASAPLNHIILKVSVQVDAIKVVERNDVGNNRTGSRIAVNVSSVSSTGNDGHCH